MPAPVIAATWSFGLSACEAAWPNLDAGGSSLDAVETACRHAESDPNVDSVGFGGLPDRDGRMSLDGCVMLAPGRCGSVCFLRRSMHPVTVARRVMERTSHVMLAGDGADTFAASCGMPEDEVLAPGARLAWEAWRAEPGVVDQSRDRGMRPIDQGPGSSGRLFTPDEARWRHHDTIGVLALDSSGTLAGACSTSGTPYKMAGRVGDSPIIGHGLYVDPAAGAATATGTGELIMGVCGAFLVVELMRRGHDPAAAIREALDRIAAAYTLETHHQVAFVAMTPGGIAASGALRPGFRCAVVSATRQSVMDPDLVHQPS